MDIEELLDKRDQARRTEQAAPNMAFRDMKELLQSHAEDDRVVITYLDDNHQQVNVTYAEFYTHVLDGARFLQNHGLSRGDRIATIAHNHWHTIVQYFAAWMLGLVVVPVNLKEDDEYIAHILEQSEVELAFVRTEYRGRFRKVLKSYDNLKHIEWIVCEGDLTNFTSKKGPLSLNETSYAESAAVLTFTGTRQPMGVVLTQRNLLHTARSLAAWHTLDNKSRVMCVLPIHQTDSIVFASIIPLYVGGSVVLYRQFDGGSFWQRIADHNITIVSLESSQLQVLVDQDTSSGGFEYPELANLEYILCRDAAPHPDTRAFEEQFDVSVIQSYGVPQTTSYASCMPVDLSGEQLRQWRSAQGYPNIGRPLSVNEMAIHDSNGGALAEKEKGEIVVRGGNVMLKYYRDREANERVFKNGWLRTGDEGFYVNDAEGRPYFFLVGQADR